MRRPSSLEIDIATWSIFIGNSGNDQRTGGLSPRRLR
jgi:hypothetical protein